MLLEPWRRGELPSRKTMQEEMHHQLVIHLLHFIDRDYSHSQIVRFGHQQKCLILWFRTTVMDWWPKISSQRFTPDFWHLSATLRQSLQCKTSGASRKLNETVAVRKKLQSVTKFMTLNLHQVCSFNIYHTTSGCSKTWITHQIM